MLKPFQDRVVTEKQELDVKISALTTFLDGEVTIFLDGEGTRNISIGDINLLAAQLHIMKEYSSILEKRISRF